MFEMKLAMGSDGSGKSVCANLDKCLVADCEYALKLNFLQPSAEDVNMLVQSCNGEALWWQVLVKMDACSLEAEKMPNRLHLPTRSPWRVGK
jgi:hypothetical protein